MSEENPFSPAKRAALREEILRDGLLADKFLSTDPDVPTYGVNLACAWPFPESWRANYEAFAARLRALGPDLYVYPFEFTHITLATLLSFSRHSRPSAQLSKYLAERTPQLLMALMPLLSDCSRDRIKPFRLLPQPIVLSRSAAILPFLNPDGEVRRLRQRALDPFRRDTVLHDELVGRGLNAPDIIHSTLLRFRSLRADLGRFLTTFDGVVAETSFPTLEIDELLLTTETKPYMRGGDIAGRFRLSNAAS